MEQISNNTATEIDKKNNRELLEKFIVLQISGENFIIPLEFVNEIVRVQEVTEAPHQPEWICGIMNLRDSVISLVDTRKRLGINSVFTINEEKGDLLKEKSNSSNIAVILKYQGINFAMLADEIAKIKTFKLENKQKGSLANSPFISGVFDDAEGLYQELDLNGILRGKNDEIIDLNIEK